MRDRPYFMEDRKWFRFDFDKQMYVLTDLAPEKARESYKEYLKETEKERKEGVVV